MFTGTVNSIFSISTVSYFKEREDGELSWTCLTFLPGVYILHTNKIRDQDFGWNI